jgi:hypothetical protein
MIDQEGLDVEEIVAGAERWDDLYLHSTIHAVELYEHPYEGKEVIQDFLSRKSLGDFKATNPFSKRIWLKELLIAFYDHPCSRKRRGREDRGERRFPLMRRARTPYKDEETRIPLMAGLKEGGVVCAFVTFTDENWACPDTHIEFDLNRAKQKIRNALSGLSFVAAFEAAYYVNEKWEKAGKEGNLVSFHCHAVVWATHYSQLSRRRKRIKPRFRAILGNKSGVRFDALKKAEDVGKALRYQAKMPARGYRTVSRGWGKKTQTSAKLSYLARYRLFTALQQYDLLDFWLAGGEGAQILREARTKLNEHRERKRLGPGSKSQPRYRSWMSSSGVSRLRAF